MERICELTVDPPPLGLRRDRGVEGFACMTHNKVMDTVLPLDRMTVEEKLRAIEVLWDDLCRNEKQVPVADWQKQLLDEREQQIQTGEAKFSDWDAAEKRIRERTS